MARRRHINKPQGQRGHARRERKILRRARKRFMHETWRDNGRACQRGARGRDKPRAIEIGAAAMGGDKGFIKRRRMNDADQRSTIDNQSNGDRPALISTNKRRCAVDWINDENMLFRQARVIIRRFFRQPSSARPEFAQLFEQETINSQIRLRDWRAAVFIRNFRRCPGPRNE